MKISILPVLLLTTLSQAAPYLQNEYNIRTLSQSYPKQLVQGPNGFVQVKRRSENIADNDREVFSRGAHIKQAQPIILNGFQSGGSWKETAGDSNPFDGPEPQKVVKRDSNSNPYARPSPQQQQQQQGDIPPIRNMPPARKRPSKAQETAEKVSRRILPHFAGGP